MCSFFSKVIIINNIILQGVIISTLWHAVIISASEVAHSLFLFFTYSALCAIHYIVNNELVADLDAAQI